MARIVLCLPPYDAAWTPKGKAYIPMPTQYLLLGTVLGGAGHDVEIVNGAADLRWRERLLASLEERPLFVGFSVMSSQVGHALEMSKRIKEIAPDQFIVWGGFHACIFPEETASHPAIDMVATGEADRTILGIVDQLEGRISRGEIPGVAYMDSSGKSVITPPAPLTGFDGLPDFDYGLLPDVEKHISKLKLGDDNYEVFPILTGLGCNFRCSFCFNAIQHRAHRGKTAERIIAEMKRVSGKFGVTTFVFQDENFFSDKKRFFEFLDLMEKEDLDFKWSANSRANYYRDDYLSGEVVDRMKRLGGFFISFGSESGNPRILKMMNKAITVDMIRRAAKTLSDHGIWNDTSFIAAAPSETRREFRDTVELILELRSRHPRILIVGPQCFRPYPGSPLYEMCRERGLKEPSSLDEWGDHSRAFSHFTRLDLSNMPWLAPEDHEYYKRTLYAIYTLNLGKGARRRLKKRFLGFLLDLFKHLQGYRLRREWFSLYLERPLMSVIERRFFT